jgi:hypothetical protein
MGNTASSDWDVASPPNNEFVSNIPSEIRYLRMAVERVVEGEHTAVTASATGVKHLPGSAVVKVAATGGLSTSGPTGDAYVSTDIGRLAVVTCSTAGINVFEMYEGMSTGWTPVYVKLNESHLSYAPSTGVSINTPADFGAMTSVDANGAAFTNSTVYKVACDGFFTVITTYSDEDPKLIIYNGTVSPPATAIFNGNIAADVVGKVSFKHNACLPIKKGTYVKIASTSEAIDKAYWMPIGSGGCTTAA